MDNSIIKEIATLGYKEKVGDIFINWENVKDEILEPERKTGTGNGTIHVFLGKEGYRLFQNEFPEYYEQVKSTNETADNAPRIRHIFSKANLISSIGHVCNYYIQKNEAEKVLNLVTKVATKLNESSDKYFFTESLFKWSTGSSDLRPYFKQFDEGFSKTVRSLLLPNSAYKISLFKNENNEYAAFWLIGFNGLTDFEVESSASYLCKESDHCICQAKKLTDFILKCVEYYKGIDNLDSVVPYAAEVPINNPIKVSKDGDFSLVGMFLEADIDEIKKRNEQHSRWFENSFSLGDRTVYLSTQWNASGNYQLTLSDFKRLIKNCYGDKYCYKSGQNGEHELWTEGPSSSNTNRKALPLQQIFYGAPGTGKSHKVKEVTETLPKSDVFRTTFHPDSDYSTFVGCYKPKMVKAPIRDSSGHEITSACEDEKKRIAYEYEPQAFLKAYVRAYETSEPVFLVIEEINRGNCAQIFGDMFQLLDRNEAGESDYAIKPETAIQEFLNEKLKNCDIEDETIKLGEEMRLPANLHIWATMNTSDQSLFPIDSAFKRRWDWRYVPIDTEKEQWCIAVNGNKYSWSSFLKNINAEIQDTTSSEDKQLGFYFCKAQNNVISAEMFVSKVLFYIYNDVFKDYGFEREFFKHTEDNSKDPLITFRSFFDAKGSVDEKVVAELLENLRVKGVSDDNVQEEDLLPEFDEDGNNASISSKDYSKYAINGLGSYSKGSVAYEAMKIYIAKNPSKNVEEIVNDWMSLNVNVPNFVETQDMFENRKRSSRDSRIKDKVKEVLVKEGQRLYVSNQYNPERIKEFISKINKSGWDINISKIS